MNSQNYITSRCNICQCTSSMFLSLPAFVLRAALVPSMPFTSSIVLSVLRTPLRWFTRPSSMGVTAKQPTKSFLLCGTSLQQTVGSNLLYSTVPRYNQIRFFSLGHHCGAAVLLSMATYMSLYPVMLLVPIILHSISREFQWIKAIKVTLTFIASTISLLFVSYKVYDTWDFLDAVYIFM